VDPEFVVDERNREQVVAICRRLDGVPLAIELAAAWVSTLAPGEILARLGDRFQLLTKGSRVAPSRQQTLADAIGWSYHLCSESEQQLWSRLSVFAGGFDLEAAEEVCAGDGLNRAHVLGLIAGLVDKSVLIRQLDTHRARARYRMLETIRQYGVDRLAAAGQETLVRTRHAVYYRKLAQRFQAEIFGPHQLEWIQRVLCEHPNIRTALEFSLTGSGQIRTATEIASALWNFWWGGCFGREGYRWLERALSVDIEPTGVRGRALATCAHFGVHLGETGTARRMLAECAQLAEQLDDPALRACYAENAGHAAMHRGELREAYTLLEQAVIRYREVKDRLGVANSLLLLASSALFLDDPRGARAAAQALELCEAHNASWTKSYALRAVALNKWRTGDHREGIRLVREAIRLQRAVGDRTSLAYLLEALAWCTSGAGEHDRAARLLGAAMLMWRLSGAKTNKTSSYEGVNEQVAKRARMELGEDRFQAEVDQGLALTIDGVFTEALSERASGKAGHGRRRGTGTPLTRREMQIAELVAQGLTNKEVAIRLVIAQRTVEAHVGNVFSKLGLTSRAQIATWIAKHRDNIDVL
jgi:DNA-binding CsgD family transcriptional regulator